MRTFKDQQSCVWGLNLTLTTARGMRRDIGVDVFNSDAFNASLSSIEAVDIFAYLLNGQMQQRWPDLKGEALLSAFGATLEPVFAVAHDALLEEIIDFFDRLGRRELAEYYRKSLDLGRRLLAKAKTEFELLDPEQIVEILLPSAKDSAATK